MYKLLFIYLTLISKHHERNWLLFISTGQSRLLTRLITGQCSLLPTMFYPCFSTTIPSLPKCFKLWHLNGILTLTFHHKVSKHWHFFPGEWVQDCTVSLLFVFILGFGDILLDTLYQIHLGPYVWLVFKCSLNKRNLPMIDLIFIFQSRD